MKAEELNLINSMIAVIKDKITNVEIQKYIENHLCDLLGKNNTMNDLTTGVEIYDEQNGKINEYFKLIFYPEKNDFNYKNFIKLETVYSFSNLKKEKKTIELIGNLVEVTELNCNHEEKNNFNTIQTVRKKKYLNDSLVYNYKLFSKISSDFLIQSYEIEEETFINDKESVTKSTIVVPKHCNEIAIKNDVEKTDTILGHYSEERFDLNNVNYITSNYLVGERFNTQRKKDKEILISEIYRPTTSDSYKKMAYKFDKKNI